MIAQAEAKHKQEKVAIILLIAEQFQMASAAALAIVQGKYILIFEVLKRLRAFQNLFFTEGVVTGNGYCYLLRPPP